MKKAGIDFIYFRCYRGWLGVNCLFKSSICSCCN